VVVFQPYKHYHAEAVDAATRTACVKYDKAEFLDAIHDIRCETFKPSTIFSAFKKTGLVPYNPEVVLAKMREAASATPPATPQAQDAEPETPETPLTIRTLKRVCRDIWHDAAALDTPPSFQHKLRAGLKGGLVQSQAGKQAFSDLEATTAAERSRRKRSRRANLQNGGVLYAENARNMVRRKEEEELEKAEAALCRAQKAQKRAQKAAHKPFLDAVKKKQKEIKARYLSKRTRFIWTPVPKREMEWKVVMSELRKVARARGRRERNWFPAAKREMKWKVVLSELRKVVRAGWLEKRREMKWKAVMSELQKAVRWRAMACS
jgi:hypothetical protein